MTLYIVKIRNRVKVMVRFKVRVPSFKFDYISLFIYLFIYLFIHLFVY